MLRIAIKTRLAVKVGTLCKRRNAERGSEQLTHRARAEPPYTFSAGC
jgi:hypothetical protein